MDQHLIDTLQQILADPQAPVTDEWVERMYEHHPAFTLPTLLRLERGADLTDERRHELTRRAALNSSDTDTLYQLIEPMAADLQNLYPPEERPVTPSTTDAISTFIDTYGHSSPDEDELLERLIFNPVPDYAQVLGASDEPEESLETLAQSLRASAAPAAAPPPSTPKRDKTTPTPSADTLLSESLAKIYIKQRRYSKAYEIIRSISLKYPEKSVYFADQLRFLQKLIINRNYTKQK